MGLTKTALYSNRLKEANELMDFGLLYTLKMKELEIGEGTDRYFEQSILKFKQCGFNDNKVKKVIAGKMNRIKLEVESFGNEKRLWF